jgi:Tfp pilus assembly protein PilP
MKKNIGLLFVIVLILVGCSKEEAQDELPKMLHVELKVSPNVAEVNETVTFQAKVTYGDEVVTDADDVTFEIGRVDQEETEKVEITSSEDGLYQYEKQFSEEGTYYVYAHVTAKSMHTMPKKEFIIGSRSTNEK